MHQHFYSFQAPDHFSLGQPMGEGFRLQAQRAILEAQGQPSWEIKKNTAQMLLSLAQPHFPDYFAELQGYALGANVDFLDFWTVALEDDAEASNEETTSHAKCTTSIINNGHTLVHSEDHFEPGLEDSVCLVRKQIGNFASIEIFYYNTIGGSSVGFTSRGYTQAINTLLNTPLRVGIPKNLIARYLFDTGDPVASFEWLQTLNIGSGFSHLITNSDGHIFHIELSTHQSFMAEPSSPYYHTNHCLLTKDYDTNDDYGTLSRLNFAQSHISENISPHELPAVLQDNSLGNDKSIFNERTVAQMIVNTQSQSAKVWLKRESSLGWVEYSL